MAGSPKARILVADDNPHVLILVSRMLETMGFETVPSQNGFEALKRFEQGDFDLVLTDLQMPGMNGWELALQVKSLAPEVPVVALTGQSEMEVMERLTGSGVDHVLFKPLNMDDLDEIVTHALASSLVKIRNGELPCYFEACSG
ncbi:MAG: response regulator [Desulfobacterales bacterium]